MGTFILRRLGVMILTALCLTFIVFFLTNLYPNLEKLAKTQGNQRMSDEAVTTWLASRGYRSAPDPALIEAARNDEISSAEFAEAVGGFDARLFRNYGEWLGVVPGYVITDEKGDTRARCANHSAPDEETPTFCGILQGYWGFSTVFKDEAGKITATRLALTGKLMFWVMVLMVPSALIIGVLAGMREGSKLDRSLSTFSIASTATPEYVSGVIFITLLASGAGWKIFKGTATSAAESVSRTIAGDGTVRITDGYDFLSGVPDWVLSLWNGFIGTATFENFTLPVLTIALYGVGYIARMTRASMAEVMTAQYIRTARLKGVSFPNIVMKHALRNALIAPFTVIMLQIPWLLNGVVIVETLFNYKGFGWTLVQAASGNDIDMLLACSVVAVFVVLVTQLISDIGYVFLNPRIRIA